MRFRRNRFATYHEVVRGNRKVSLSYIGEGYNGDYDETDPEDAQLLRLDIYELVDGEWESMDDGSYCTGVKVQTDSRLVSRILNEMMDVIAPLERVKKAGEQLSWVST